MLRSDAPEARFMGSVCMKFPIACLAAGAGLVIALGGASPAFADEPPPPVSLALRQTLDGWAVPAGVDPGLVALDKLQFSATLTGDSQGLPGVSAHVQIFRTAGGSLS